MKRKGSGMIAMGLALILAAAALAGYNALEARQAQKASMQVVQILEQQLPLPESQPDEASLESLPGDTVPATQPDHVRFPNKEMPIVTVDGQDYIGTVAVPSLELELPVIADWSYPALKIAPCRYQGSAYTGDLILMAHNYNSHFGRLKELRPGDTVSFTDMDGNVFSYQVVELEELPGTAVEDMSAGQWDLTLFTCTYGGQSRVTIRCEKQPES